MKKLPCPASRLDVLRADDFDRSFSREFLKRLLEVADSVLPQFSFRHRALLTDTVAPTLLSFVLLVGFGERGRRDGLWGSAGHASGRTLGDELADVVPVSSTTSHDSLDGSRFRMLSLARRIMLFLFHAGLVTTLPAAAWSRGAVTTFLLARMKKALLFVVPTNTSTEEVDTSTRTHLSKSLELLKIGAIFHLAVFYFCGTYRSLAHRLVGIRYLSLLAAPKVDGGTGVNTTADGSSETSNSFRLLGILTALRGLAQLHKFVAQSDNVDPAMGLEEDSDQNQEEDVYLLPSSQTKGARRLLPVEGWKGAAPPTGRIVGCTTIGSRLWDRWSSYLERHRVPRTSIAFASGGVLHDSDSDFSCAVCQRDLLAPKKRCPTSIPCGHCFCWACVARWVHKNQSCPLCRTRCVLQDLWPLVHASC